MTLGQYQLIDFGDGRKLESLAGYLVDRPAPAAVGAVPQQFERWGDADARYDPLSKRWSFKHPWPESLTIDCGGFRMPVQPTPFGHIGLFPEQAANWAWLRERAEELGGGLGHRFPPPAEPSNGPPAPSNRAPVEAVDGESTGVRRAPASWGLNLFGYTGASTLALASAGLGVAHVDAAKPNVQACRRAVEANGWDDAPIRYLVDDAAKFVAREVRRGRCYAAVVLDPPAYGHAPGGKAWRLERDLWPLVDHCLELLEEDFVLLITGHSPQVDQTDVAEFLRRHRKLQPRWRASGLNLRSGRSQLRDEQGRTLDAGFFVRLWSQPRSIG